MAANGTRSTPSLDLSGGTAGILAAELHNAAENIHTASEEAGTARINAARVQLLRRVARQCERIVEGEDE